VEMEYKGLSIRAPQQGMLRCIYIANYIKTKGIGDLLGAFRQLGDLAEGIQLDCYGNFSHPEYKSFILDLAKDKRNISINGPITGSDKFERLAASDVFIFPSHNEGMPLVLLEAMSVGLPVITTKVGYVNEILGDDYPFYCLPENEASIISTLQQYMVYPRKEELSQYLKNRYHELFSRESHRKFLLQIFS
jgi:glycosyltransferase involved in cell wall biosynthesis